MCQQEPIQDGAEADWAERVPGSNRSRRRRRKEGEPRSSKCRLQKLSVSWRNWVNRLRKKMNAGLVSHQEYMDGRVWALSMMKRGREMWRKNKQDYGYKRVGQDPEDVVPQPAPHIVMMSYADAKRIDEDARREWEEMVRQMEEHMVSGGCGDVCTPCFETCSFDLLD